MADLKLIRLNKKFDEIKSYRRYYGLQMYTYTQIFTHIHTRTYQYIPEIASLIKLRVSTFVHIQICFNRQTLLRLRDRYISSVRKQ